MGKLSDIFKNYGQEYIQTYPNLPRNHQKVIQAIIDCRSGSLGKTIYQCQGCGQVHVINQSCLPAMANKSISNCRIAHVYSTAQ